MSEVAPQPSKQEKMPSVEANSEALQKHLDALKQKAEADGEAHADDEALEAIKKTVEATAASKEDYNTSESSADNAPSATFVSNELKTMGGRRTLNNVRRHLNAPSRAFSKVIHQSAVEKVSEVAAPTVARPSGILGGGIFALLGSLILLYATKHYGYTYNYFVFVILFVGGFVAGMLVELIVRALFRKKA